MVARNIRKFSLTPNPKGPLLDYSKSFTSIQTAVLVLNEALPEGNADLVEAKFKQLKENVEELGCFLRGRGLDV